ncbi:hypothetical protein BDA99DRAFT_563514 [Phascolomyces articulosus]|uniref:Uncharacterized protein n=1 Tax=Phascolomyces articulosus TaxID=60185 RepID=A0AAD5K266_9FUNG|nr:hypothetical protein BDA99DRAFT_563514 [Phascolomyces articulosus]
MLLLSPRRQNTLSTNISSILLSTTMILCQFGCEATSLLPNPTSLSNNCICIGGEKADPVSYNGYATRTCCDTGDTGYYFTYLDFCTGIDKEYGDVNFKRCCQLNGAMDSWCSGPLPDIFPRT